MDDNRNRDAMLFTSEFSSFAFVIGRTTFFSLVSFHRSRFLLANTFYVSFVRNLFFVRKSHYL